MGEDEVLLNSYLGVSSKKMKYPGQISIVPVKTVLAGPVLKR